MYCMCIDICICWVASTNQSMYSWFKLRTHSLLFLWRLFFFSIIYVRLGGAATCFLCFLSKMFCNTFLVIGHFYIYKQRCISQINKCNDKPLLKAQSSLVFLPMWCCRKIWGRCSVGLNVDHLVALGENELWFSRGNLVPPAPPQNELHSNRAYYLPINRKLFISMPLFRSMSERQQQCYWVRYKIWVLHLLGACEMFMYSISEHVCTCPLIPQEHWGMALEFVFIHDHLIFYLLLLCKYLNQL